MPSFEAGTGMVGRCEQLSRLVAHRGHRAVVELLRQAGAPVRLGHEEVAKQDIDGRIGLAPVREAQDAAACLGQPAVGQGVSELGEQALDLVRGVLLLWDPRGRGEGPVAAKPNAEEVEESGDVRGCGSPQGGRRHRTWLALFATLALNALTALFLGLLASASVTSVAQAALALPMLCFPAVLFAGAMVPVPVMTSAGATIAVAMPDRWAFEAIARHLDVAALVPAGSPYARLGASSSALYWGILAGAGLLLALAGLLVVARRAR